MSMSPPPPPPPSFGYQATPTRAGFGKRFLGWLVDIIISIVVSLPVILILESIGIDMIQTSSTNNEFKAQGNVGAQIVIGLIGSAVWAWFLSNKGATPGMMVANLKCVRRDTGANLSFGAAFGRGLMSIVSQAVCLLGYFWSIWDKEKQTWHDKVVDSVVITQ
jgi:uncharacterized RDD family membrane protein YckC